MAKWLIHRALNLVMGSWYDGLLRIVSFVSLTLRNSNEEQAISTVHVFKKYI